MRLRASDIFTTTVDGEMVILDTQTSNYLKANPAATYLVELLQADTSESALTDSFRQRFELDPDTARRDTAAFLDRLRRLGYLEE